MITIWYLRWIFIIRKNRGVIQLVGIPFFSLSILLLLRLHFYTIIIILTDFNQNFELSLQQKLGKPCKNGIKYLPRARWLWVLVGHPPPRSRFCPHQAEMQQNNLFRQNNQPYLFYRIPIKTKLTLNSDLIKASSWSNDGGAFVTSTNGADMFWSNETIIII